MAKINKSELDALRRQFAAFEFEHAGAPCRAEVTAVVAGEGRPLIALRISPVNGGQAMTRVSHIDQDALLRWTGIAPGMWVDQNAFYCIRRISACDHQHADLSGLDAYEACETYPGCHVDSVIIAHSLHAAKQGCQRHRDSLGAFGLRRSAIRRLERADHDAS